ncbi:MAG: type VII secretion-associated protein [Mycolicibacterium neoaurum]|uniref:type VII secretion-associated protein n=1 Tax=Mycolicibacterium neoaurum TaxID=1795 RepID=UPI000560F70E|nr:type VII secretion-associated protein [Mycolicibacterium neoaurum]QVI27436.1 type VII secretion-associated protein [Mycolicibacterium neoaurum]SDC92555.1 type VII secretion-associated protein, Rv3446c family, C-terminal domain-containing protein [Mycolicibacterium neoaurum]
MTVLVVGPATVHGSVHGSVPVSIDLATAACAAIDDRYTIVDDRPVDVDDLWRTVLRVDAERTGPVLLICPGWWHPRRIDRIRRAVGGEPVVRQRHTAHRRVVDVIVEIAEEFVLVRVGDRVAASVPRVGDTVAAEVAAHITVGASVLLDAPIGVSGARRLAETIAGDVLAGGRDAVIVDDHVLVRETIGAARPRRVRMSPALVGVAVVAVCVMWMSWRVDRPPPAQDELVVEGRVALLLPAGWERSRLVDGPGSPRLQSISAEHPDAAILLTQSPAGPDAAGVLAAALAVQPDGVFTDFRQHDRRAERDVISYTENRPGRTIEWVVFTDGPVRIAIGCQHPGPIRSQCDLAMRSAHAASTDRNPKKSGTG